jgi:hypothetical protein
MMSPAKREITSEPEDCKALGLTIPESVRSALRGS